MKEICDDLEAELNALDEIVANLDEQSWSGPTPAEGWDIKETIVHLLHGDMAAHLAVTNADKFALAKERIASGGFDREFGHMPSDTGAEVLAGWRSERQKMLGAFRPLGSKDRIPWFGPDMSALSFATARLMEAWSHGRDIADAVGVDLVATDRLRHVAHIGVSTRSWSYVNRGLIPPDEPVRVELRSPSGSQWDWGPPDATARVSGEAEEFCLLVTQRRHISETSLLVEGDSAAEWLVIAQAFAGPPTLPAPKRVDL